MATPTRREGGDRTQLRATACDLRRRERTQNDELGLLVDTSNASSYNQGALRKSFVSKQLRLHAPASPGAQHRVFLR